MHPSRPMATTVIALALAAFAAPSPATAAPGDSYVALGDSCSSGTGTRQYISDGTECLRSTLAYPSLVAAAGDLVAVLVEGEVADAFAMILVFARSAGIDIESALTTKWLPWEKFHADRAAGLAPEPLAHRWPEPSDDDSQASS